jgi:hypothetical protein
LGLVALQDVTLKLPGSADSLSAVVQWSQAGAAGLLFSGTGAHNFRALVTPLLRSGGWGPEHFSQRREYRRLSQDLSVDVQDTKEKRWQGKLLNIGLGGAALSFKPARKLGEQLGVLVPTGKKSGVLHLPAVVVAIRDDIHHLKFLPMKATFRKRLETYLKSQEKS